MLMVCRFDFQFLLPVLSTSGRTGTTTMANRLNPKLTRRSVQPQASYDTTITTPRSIESYTDSNTGTEYTEESSQYDGGPVLENTNPRLHLLHNGQWVPKKVSRVL